MQGSTPKTIPDAAKMAQLQAFGSKSVAIAPLAGALLSSALD